MSSKKGDASASGRVDRGLPKKEVIRMSSSGAYGSGPEFRSMPLVENTREAPLASRKLPPPKSFERDSSHEVIDKASFFEAKTTGEKDGELKDDLASQSSNFLPTNLRPVPAFYPLEKSSRFIDDELGAVATRISECLRVLSVQAIYDNEMATASLLTGENVEMHLSLWKTNGEFDSRPDGIVVELQRRKGDSIIFHRYSRHVLDAAIGDFDLPEFVRTHGDDVDRNYSRKLERLLSTGRDTGNEEENAIIAIEIAHGFLMKDRMDARQLGLESLCLLTDPRKSGVTTAMLASHVVLLGTTRGPNEEREGMLVDEAPFQEIRETILSLVQLRRIGDESEFSDDDGVYEDDLDNDFGGRPLEGNEYISLLNNLALAVMANALDVIENLDNYETEPEETTNLPRARARTQSSDVANTFMNDAKDFSKRELMSTLIQELGKAERKPHNACLSAKCLRCLFGASEDARRRARELGAKTVVNTALDIGERTHAKLETECKKVVKVMTENPDDNN